MNIRYKNPEVIAAVRIATEDGDDRMLGDKVCGFGVITEGADNTPVLQIDIRNFRGSKNLVFEIELSEAIQAISAATLNKEP